MDIQLIRWNINRRIQVQYFSTSPQHLWITTWWEILHWFLHTLPCKRRIISIHRIRTHGASSRWNWGMCPMNVAQWTVSNLNCPSEQGLGEMLWVLSNLSSLFLYPKNGSSQVQIAYRRSGWFFLPWFWMRSYVEQNPGWRMPQPTHDPRCEQEWIPCWKLTPQVEGESSPHPQWATALSESFIFTFKMTLAGRHSQSSKNRDTDKECISKVTNCIHWDKSHRKTVVLFSLLPKANWLNVKIIFSYCMPSGIAFPPNVIENWCCGRLFHGMNILIREEERGTA